MHFYRSLASIQAITFDLDDTLYDNGPVIEKTEQQTLLHLQQTHTVLEKCELSDLYACRRELQQKNEALLHDVTLARWQATQRLLMHHGYSESNAATGADDAMACFAYWRSQIEIPTETHQTLRALAQHYPLAVITNGNVQPEACGLADYFQCILRAGPAGRAKPYADMYLYAAEKLQVPIGAILHVGDDLITDVAGAIRSGAQACWINTQQRDLKHAAESRLLPHVEITQLSSLLTLLGLC